MLANKKPWGYEFLAYQNDDIAIWHLYLDPWQETSLHCHPNKKTGLIVLSGGALISFLSGGEKVFAGEKVMIRQGVFHKTKNMTSEPLELFEIETPVNKSDLVRIGDIYGRKGIPYGEEPLIEIEKNYIIDENPNHYYGIGDCCVGIVDLSNSIEYESIEQTSQYMIIKGGIYSEEALITGPGDIVSGANFKKLVSVFKLSSPTIGLEISNEHRQYYP